MNILADSSTTLPTWTAVFPILAAMLVVFGFLWKGLRSVWRTIKRANETIDAFQEIIQEWSGQRPANGDPGRPSLPVRLANLERAVLSQTDLLDRHIRQHPSATRTIRSQP